MLAFVVAAALAPCAPGRVPALTLQGIPAVAIPGRTYEAALVGDGAVVDNAGADIGIKDARGKGWTAHYEFARGVRQQFSVGLEHPPFTVTASWTEPTADGSTCLRTVSVPLPIERRILAVVDCRRGAEAPRSGLVLRCDGRRLRLHGLRWRRWNADTTVGAGRLGKRAVRVTLSRPRECATLDGYAYTQAVVRHAGRVVARTAITCPLP